MFLGEWLNGRVAVSKTVGCVFESRLPCHSGRVSKFDTVLIGLFRSTSFFYYNRLIGISQANESALLYNIPIFCYYNSANGEI